MWDLTINLLASAIAGAAVWLTQYALRRRRLHRMRTFFGLAAEAPCVFFVSRHASSPHPNSVHRADMGALLELAVIARDCGSRPQIASFEDRPLGLGELTEFSVGGPTFNPRTESHLRRMLPGVDVSGTSPRPLTFTIGGQVYECKPGRVEYVLVARVFGPNGGRPVFVLCGQTALSNQAGARHLRAEYAQLGKTYGDRPFSLMLRVVDTDAYGPAVVDQITDVTADATTPLPQPQEPAAA
ncbi:hypothetical protein ACFQY4_33755 [Catellatospora bangladeshensis]|uniref:Secreted protein n=1 Tax=Catellatospora bangladeshensis TaxID=310355 RepID=A0A8J3NIA7_9ACTN|nr:hypothetical protein [Catellatospora bangladeshensis]GIF82255.1 hypothetical protein Cba03nite_36040 [Catellatospora bangladeshensis]